MTYAYRVKISRHDGSDDDVSETNSYYRIPDERGQWNCSGYSQPEIISEKKILIDIIRNTCLINKLGLRWAKLRLSCGLD